MRTLTLANTTKNTLKSKSIKYISITGQTSCQTITPTTPVNCYPDQAKKPCIPQDEFDMIESCKLCNQKF